jgi:hypothetical protein
LPLPAIYYFIFIIPIPGGHAVMAGMPDDRAGF